MATLKASAFLFIALVSRFKADTTRITPYGVANVAPVAANTQEAGRALNRRVELVVR